MMYTRFEVNFLGVFVQTAEGRWFSLTLEWQDLGSLPWPYED